MTKPVYINISQVNLASVVEQVIMITSTCNVYPLTPHFYIVKLGYRGIHFFLFLL